MGGTHDNCTAIGGVVKRIIRQVLHDLDDAVVVSADGRNTFLNFGDNVQVAGLILNATAQVCHNPLKQFINIDGSKAHRHAVLVDAGDFQQVVYQTTQAVGVLLDGFKEALLGFRDFTCCP